MSTPKKPKATLPTPPPRTRSHTPQPIKTTKSQLPISPHPRTRSRSANNRPHAHDHPSPPAPQRTKSRGRTPNKPNKFPPPKRSRSSSKSRNHVANKINKFDKKLPSKPTKPKPPIKHKNKKQLPNTPIRNRSKTTVPPKTNSKKRIWPPVSNKKSNDIDNRPMLKPSHSKKKSLPKYNKKKQDEKKQDEKKQNHSTKPKPPPKTGGHQRDYSIVKSIPLMFKTISAESPKNTNKFRFGLKRPPKKKGLPSLKKREGLIHGSCQCGKIKYELLSLPQELQHCYCSMCRKLHGSSVSTWTPYLEQDIKFISKGKQTKYKSSKNVIRSFCSNCGSNISLKYSFQKDTIWLTPSLFNGPTKKNKNNLNCKTWWLNVRILHIFCASKCEWYDIPNDGYPQLSQTDIQNSEINGEPRFLYSKELPPKPAQN